MRRLPHPLPLSTGMQPPRKTKLISNCFIHCCEFWSRLNAIFIFLITLIRCGPLIDLCRGPHVRHTGKIKAMKIYKVKQSKHILGCFFYYFPFFQHVSNFSSSGSTSVPLHSVDRTRRPTGRAAPTWRLCRGSTGSPSQIQRCWRSGSAFRRRPRIETTARLAKSVAAKVHHRGNQTPLKCHSFDFIALCVHMSLICV